MLQKESLTEEQWRLLPDVFDRRNMGEDIPDEEVCLIAKAWEEDRGRARRIMYQSAERTLTK